MHAYRTEGPVRLAFAADGPFEAVVRDAVGAEVERIATEAEDGSAVVEFAPARLGRYAVETPNGTVYVDYRAEPYFTVDQFRAYDDGSKLSADLSDDDIERVREHVEGVFDRAAGTPFVPCGTVETVVGVGTARLRTEAAMPLRAYEASTAAGPLEGLAARGMGFDAPRAVARGEAVRIAFEHGYAVRPAALLRNALVYADSIVGAPAVNPRAMGAQAEFGYMKFSVAGKDGATGIPEVDAFLSSDPSAGGFGVARAVVA